MKRIRIVGLCLLAAFAFSAVAVSTASAAAPEFGRCIKKAKAEGTGYSEAKCNTKGEGKTAKYEWVAGIVNGTFTSAIKAGTTATLETVGKTKITCKGETSGGEIATTKEVQGVIAKFTSCESAGLKCQSGATTGEIETKALSGVIGFETETGEQKKWKIAEELHGPGNGNLAEFSCGPAKVLVHGSVLHNIKANTMLSESTEKFTASKGKQKPEHFAGGKAKEHILESNLAGGPYEQAGQTITAIVKFAEKGEANGVV